MNELLMRSWWMFAVRGGLAVLFGVLALLWPGMTLIVLVALFAAYALLGGGAMVIGAIRHRKSDDKWWIPLLLGIVSLAAGVWAVMLPEITMLVLVLVMGVNALITGVLEIALAIRLRKTIEREWMLVLAGAVSIAFGVLVLLFPAAGAFAMVWMVSFYAMLTGILLLALAFRLRREAKRSNLTNGNVQHFPRQPAT
jgi:uncharacterized membrane protein HdeD (DUF308 family)